MLLTCTLYYDAGPGCLISSIRTVYKHRKCSLLTGLITSLTDLLKVNHQGRIDISKTKSTGSPVPAPDRFALRILLFRACRNFFPPSPGACSQAKNGSVGDHQNPYRKSHQRQSAFSGIHRQHQDQPNATRERNQPFQNPDYRQKDSLELPRELISFLRLMKSFF